MTDPMFKCDRAAAIEALQNNTYHCFSKTEAISIVKTLEAKCGYESKARNADALCPDCGRSVDGPTHAAYCAVHRRTEAAND